MVTIKEKILPFLCVLLFIYCSKNNDNILLANVQSYSMGFLSAMSLFFAGYFLDIIRIRPNPMSKISGHAIKTKAKGFTQVLLFTSLSILVLSAPSTGLGSSGTGLIPKFFEWPMIIIGGLGTLFSIIYLAILNKINTKE